MAVASSAHAVLVGDSPRRPELDRFVDRLLEVPDGLRGLGLQGLSRERVDVERDDGEDVAAADRENADALQRARRDGPWRAVVDDAIEELAGSLGALRRRPRQDRGAENGDLTVVVDQGGRLRPVSPSTRAETDPAPRRGPGRRRRQSAPRRWRRRAARRQDLASCSCCPCCSKRLAPSRTRRLCTAVTGNPCARRLDARWPGVRRRFPAGADRSSPHFVSRYDGGR